MKRQNVIVGTLVLSGTAIFVRLLGFGFRIWLSNTVGAEGIGVYSLIMSLFTVCVTVATSGIAAGVSKLAAKEFADHSTPNARRILGRALNFSLFLSISVGVALFFLAPLIGANILKEERTILSLRLLAFGLPMLATSGCLRGYFIAQRKVSYPAASQVAEQVFKMVLIVALMGTFLPMGIEYACAVIVLGMVFGEVICLSIFLFGYAKEKRNTGRLRPATIKGVTRSLLTFAIPVSVGSYIRSGLRLVEDVLIMSGLRAFSGLNDVATGTYGLLKGMVMPLLTFPLSLLSAFVITLTPEISRMSGPNDRKKLERTISRILQFTTIIGVFIVCIFMSFSYEIGMVVYKSPEAGDMLKALSWLCPFMCIEMVVVSILQGLGEQVSSLRYNVADCFLRIGMVYLLIPTSGVRGFMWMVVASNLFTSLLNLFRLIKITKMSIHLSDWVFKPVLAALATCQVMRVILNFYLFEALPTGIGLILGIGAIGLIYLVVLFAVGSISPKDFSWALSRLRISQKPWKSQPEQQY